MPSCTYSHKITLAKHEVESVDSINSPKQITSTSTLSSIIYNNKSHSPLIQTINKKKQSLLLFCGRL